VEAAERNEARGGSCGEKLEKKVLLQKITPHILVVPYLFTHEPTTRSRKVGPPKCTGTYCPINKGSSLVICQRSVHRNNRRMRYSTVDKSNRMGWKASKCSTGTTVGRWIRTEAA
jgi:hypothetical protein